MAKQRTLQRLLRLRQLEEEQSRQQLEVSVVARDRTREQIALATERQALGRQQFVTGVLRQSPLERTGAMLEMEQARRDQLRLLPALEAADIEVTRQRIAFLEHRTGRRQVETLVDDERIKAEAELARRAQQILDDWYGRRGATARQPPDRKAAPSRQSEG